MDTIDHLGHMQAANEAAHSIFGYADGELTGRKVAMLMPVGSRASHEHGLARVAAGRAPRLVGLSNVQVRGLRSDGTEFALELTLSAVPLPDDMLFVGVKRDITERRAMEDKMSHMAQYDSLTGLTAGGQTLNVTTSIGLVLHELEGTPSTASDLLSLADGAMYAAKRAGKDACRTFVSC